MNSTSPAKEKKITINELAAMVQRGFSDMEKKFFGKVESLDIRFDSLEAKMDRRFDDVQSQIDGIYVNYTTMREHDLLKTRVAVLEKRREVKR